MAETVLPANSAQSFEHGSDLHCWEQYISTLSLNVLPMYFFDSGGNSEFFFEGSKSVITLFALGCGNILWPLIISSL
jgi:hypothetical protein